MGCLGNVIWFLCGGVISGLSWLLTGCLWCITIIGIPVGMICPLSSRQVKYLKLNVDDACISF